MTDKDIPRDQDAPPASRAWPAQPAADSRGATPQWATTPPPPAAGGMPPAAPPTAPSDGPTYAPPAAPAAPGGPAGPVSWMEADLGDGAAPPPTPPKRRPGLVVAATVGAGALLLGGVAVGQAFGGTSDTTSLTAQTQPGQMGQAGPGRTDQQGGTTQQQGGGQGGTGGGPPGTDDGTMVVGQVAEVNGSTLTLESRSGTVTVTTTSSTTVDGAAGGDLSALATGTLVLVQGDQTSDGTWTATAVSTTPAGRRGGPPGQDQQGSTQDRQGSTQDQQGTTQGGTGQQGTTGTTT